MGMLNSFVKMKKYGNRFYFGFSSFANLRSPKTSQAGQAAHLSTSLILYSCR